MGCSTSTLDDDPHPAGPNTVNKSNNNQDDKNGQGDKEKEQIITYENNESQGNKFISNDDL